MITVGVSGGVDSSVAALLLKQQGQDVRGCFMTNWPVDHPGCRGEQDRLDALRVCGLLQVPFQSRNFSSTYQEEVFAQFLSDYKSGRTPNPDILCNREVKFKVFLNDALSQGSSLLATGHYAQKGVRNGRNVLLRARDPSKDQSYFLHAITQTALDHSVFPIGHLLKSQVRDLARDAGLLTANKKDSTGICFIEPGNFRTFLASFIPAQKGAMVTQEGRVIGEHTGSMYYTIGQRAPVGGVKGIACDGWFVARKDVATNTLVLVPGSDHPALMSSSVTTDPVSWISGCAPHTSFEASVQIRHLGQAHRAQVSVDQDNMAHIAFEHPVRACAEGQSAAIYLDDHCLGGGTIRHRFM